MKDKKVRARSLPNEQVSRPKEIDEQLGNKRCRGAGTISSKGRYEIMMNILLNYNVAQIAAKKKKAEVAMKRKMWKTSDDTLLKKTSGDFERGVVLMTADNPDTSVSADEIDCQKIAEEMLMTEQFAFMTSHLQTSKKIMPCARNRITSASASEPDQNSLGVEKR
ncbi:hypothetical protein AXG93_2752s2130 [Marchantia polymorpha subsp. ruderalis]|uniref:Uncharacterized protein n=1 Tax=Marchantia polymorpha subsp. ruderalis TaxID=1480154 RepID=A0A176VWD9_MARPO|nr:hypothetical protein AXG93_2752s2130 [Marchantia polymorpha subsp. ruderalis]